MSAVIEAPIEMVEAVAGLHLPPQGRPAAAGSDGSQ